MLRVYIYIYMLLVGKGYLFSPCSLHVSFLIKIMHVHSVFAACMYAKCLMALAYYFDDRTVSLLMLII